MKKYIYSYGLQTTVCNDGLEIILSSQIIVVWRSNEKCAWKSKPIDNFSNFCEVFWLLWKAFHAVAEEGFLKWQKNDGYLMCKTEVHRHFLQFLCILVYESSTEKPHHNTFLQDKIHARRV